MKFSLRKFLFIFGVLAFTTLGFAGFIVWLIYSKVASRHEFGETKLPAEIREARILKGEGILNKSEVFKLKQKGFLETISDGISARDQKENDKILESNSSRLFYNFADIKRIGEKIIACGRFGAFIFDLEGNLEKEILFEPSVEKLKVGWWEEELYNLNLDNLKVFEPKKGQFGFISHGYSGGAIVYDEDGNQVWSYGKRNILDISATFESEEERAKRIEESNVVWEAAAGDLDGDGIAEYVVGMKDNTLIAFNSDGTEKWKLRVENTSPRLHFYDLDADGRNELIQTGRMIRNGADGKAMREIKGDSASVVLFEGEKEKKLIHCALNNNNFICFDEAGREAGTYETPLAHIKTGPKKIEIPYQPPINDPSNPGVRAEPIPGPIDDSENLYEPKAIRVNMGNGREKCLAVVGDYTGLPRSNFYLYDNSGKLIYHELLPESAETIEAIPGKNNSEAILIGGKESIWKFEAN